jgi:hypothetical protein
MTLARQRPVSGVAVVEPGTTTRRRLVWHYDMPDVRFVERLPGLDS